LTEGRHAHLPLRFAVGRLLARTRSIILKLNQRPISNGRRGTIVLCLRSLESLAQILWICVIAPGLVWAGHLVGWTALRLFFRFETYILAPILIFLWSRTDKHRLISPAPPKVDINSLGLEPCQLKVLRADTLNKSRVEIGELDQDGFLLSKVGPIPGIPCVTAKDFLPRNRSKLHLVLLGDSVAIEKDFRGVKSFFVRELTALQKLSAAGCPVPAILDVDVKKCRLTMPFIRGMVLREELAKAGAVLRDRDIVGHVDYRGLSQESADLKRIEAGRKVLQHVVTKNFVDTLHRRLQDIHTAGVAHLGVKYGNILIERDSKEPRLIDFGEASPVSFCGKFLFSLLRDHDTEQFNLHFGTNHLTYRLTRARLRQMKARRPVYLGCGLSLGKPWQAAISHGRWLDFMKHNLPSLAGQRILNLGAGNGFHALQLLRFGVRQVVAIESDADLVKQGQFVKEAFEWTDNRRYDLKYIQMDMFELATHDLDRFDVVFALFCLARSDASSVARMLKHLSTIAPVLVCQYQVGEEISQKNGSPDKTTALGHPKRLLEENGFSVRGFATQSDHKGFIIAEAA